MVGYYAISVSYTHLFVDKGLRERLEHVKETPFVRCSYTEAVDILLKSGKTKRSAALCTGMTRRTASIVRFIRLFSLWKNGMVTVSYTHLAVYKRQDAYAEYLR